MQLKMSMQEWDLDPDRLREEELHGRKSPLLHQHRRLHGLGRHHLLLPLPLLQQLGHGKAHQEAVPCMHPLAPWWVTFQARVGDPWTIPLKAAMGNQVLWVA